MTEATRPQPVAGRGSFSEPVFDPSWIWTTIVAFFEAGFYARVSGVDGAAPARLLQHFRSVGLAAGLPPHPLLDPEEIAVVLAEHGLASDEEPALCRWVRVGMPRGIVPTDLFDAAFYEQTYPDLTAGRFGFEHFLTEGASLGLRPNPWFDPAWYSAVTDGIHPDEPAFSHFVTTGAQRGLAPHPLLAAARLEGVTLGDWRYHGSAVVRRLEALERKVGYDQVELVLSLFEHQHYALVAPESGPTLLARLEHFLTYGLETDLPPSPLFEPETYRAAVQQATGRDVAGPALLHWLREGRSVMRVPTRLFSEAHYRTTYPDMADPELDVFDHFVRHGIDENRQGNPWFDEQFQPKTGKARGTPRFLRRLMQPASLIAPNRALSRIVGALAEAGPGDAAETLAAIERFARLSAGSTRLLPRLDLQGLTRAVLLFTPEAYPGGFEHPLDALSHFLLNRADAPDLVLPLFDAGYYVTRAAAAGLEVGETPPLVHFLNVGVAQRIVPTPLFDERHYLARNADLADYPEWLFLHFIEHGLYEGRDYSPLATISVAPSSAATLAEAARQGLAIRAAAPAAKGMVGVLAQAQARVQRVLASPVFTQIVARAQAIEPLVGDPDERRDHLVTPFHDRMGGLLAAVRQRLPRAHYDYVVCVPWLRSGGADLVAGILTQALRRTFPDRSILLLCTDFPQIERTDWLADDVDVVGLSDIMAKASHEESARLLHTVLRGLSPRALFNVNSRLCFQVLRRFGRRLEGVRLFAYMFCWDRLPSGLKAGYPSEFFSDIIMSLDALLTDTTHLRDELTQMYRLPPDVTGRITRLATPARSDRIADTMAQRGAASAGTRARPLILWGGRLDRQKRFDLVIEIARRMPEVDFHCWGAALLDDSPDGAGFPANIAMQGAFKRLEDLPLGASDAWLFTSAWEGMPTTLIELGSMGVPIIASAVGGVPELIDASTGWLVDPFDDVDAYVTCLAEALAAPKERVRRAKRLQARVRKRHSIETYSADLLRLLGDAA